MSSGTAFVDVDEATKRRLARRVIGASMVGTTIEWYDFFIYGVAASLVFNKIFFPESDPLVGTLLALLTYAVGFAARPIGGIIFGHLGDRVGRKKLLMASLTLMGLATVLVGLMPTYAAIGPAAPITLTVLRVLQGIAVGGEYGGAVLLVAENAAPAHRGLWASFPQIGAPLGSVLANGLLLALSGGLSDDAFRSWGWRIPFLLSAVLLLIGYYIRRKVEEPQLFLEAQATRVKEARAKVPAFEVIRTFPKHLLVTLGGYFAINVLYYIVLTFSLVYIVDQGISRNVGLIGVLVGSVIQVGTIPLVGAWSDRVGRRTPYLVGSVGMIGFAFILFPLLRTGSVIGISLALVLGLGLHSLMYAPQASMFAELFPTRVRYTGISLGVQLPTIFAGGLAPVIATSLLAAFGSWLPVAFYLAASAVLTTVAIALAPETRGRDLREEPPITDGVVPLSAMSATKTKVTR